MAARRISTAPATARTATTRRCSTHGWCSEAARTRARNKGSTMAMKYARSFAAAVALGAVALIATGGSAMATMLAFQADLSGGGEVPPNASAATGHVDATLDTESNT